jgi:cysteine synthase A
MGVARGASGRAWSARAIQLVKSEQNRSADTHLLTVDVPGLAGVSIYLKDESSHPTGSLKHRLARSLFLYALSNNWLREGMTVVEASSGSTAVSEAYFARMLELPFVAVMPRCTAREKIEKIEFYGGKCHYVDAASKAYGEAMRLAQELDGHYMDQFTYAERATDWRSNNNIAHSIFEQLACEAAPVPQWIVCGAGTGGTSATLGRYVRYHGHATRLCLADPEHSVFHRHWKDRRVAHYEGPASLIEGIGRARLEPSFIPDVVDRAIGVSDVKSIAAARVLSRRLGRRCGGSTGTNFWVCAELATAMVARGERGSVVSILCDHGERYASTLFSDAWLTANAIAPEPYEARLEGFLETGCLAPD